MKKLLNVLITAFVSTMLLSSVVLADTTAPAFKDVDATTDEGKAIVKMYNAGILAGYEDGTFKPEGSITRAELVRVFNQVFKYTVDEETTTPDFKDNTDSTVWYYNDVKIAQANGYINGFEDNTFRPQENFTRQQVCVVMDLITNLTLPEIAVEISDPVSEWATNYVNRALVAGFFTLEEGNTFRATENITRGEVCELLAIFVPEVTEENTDDSEASTEETEDKTEVITAKTSNGTVVSVTTGGGGGGSSSSSNKTTTTTVESSTEATTKDATETSTSASSNKTTESSTEATTETTTEKVTQTTTEATTETTTIVVDTKPSAEIVDALNRVYRNTTKYVIPKCTTDAQKAAAKGIIDAIYNYLLDYSYDFTGQAQSVIADYKALPSAEKDALKNLIIEFNAVGDLIILQEHYFPGLI